jgi:hypothetical protein
METSASATEAAPRVRRLDFEEFFLDHHETAMNVFRSRLRRAAVRVPRPSVSLP